MLTGITDEVMQGSQDFANVVPDFFKFVNLTVDELKEIDGKAINCVVFES